MRQQADMSANDGAVWPEQLAVRVAWCYYMLGLTQAQIAERLEIPRMRVNRLLAQARERGLVSISIHSRLTENIELEEQLCERFGLVRAHVALAEPPIADHEDPALAELLGRVAAPIVDKLILPGVVIGVGWGNTLRALASAMVARPTGKEVSVISMVGSLNRRSSIDAYEASTPFAQKLGAECFYLAAPLICDSSESRQAIVSQPALVEMMERARHADLAMLSVGGPATGTVAQTGLVEADELAELQAAGAVGNFLGHYIDAEARVVDHPVNDRVVGLRPEELAGVGHRVMVSGGPLKLPGLRAVLQAGLVSELVTDQDSARRLLSP